MTKLYWVNFLHFYQPPFLSPALLKIIIKESYEFILKHLEKYPNRKLTLNISGSLTEHLKKEDQSVLNRLKKLVVDGQVELVSSAKYHPILPLLPLMEVKRQIKLHDDINRAVFGAAYQPTGFYLPEMAYSRPVAELLKELGYRWIIIDEIAFNGALGQVDWETKYQIKNPGLNVIFRNRRLSNTFVPAAIKELLGKTVRPKYAVTATDAELYGHHHKDYNQVLKNIFLNPEIETLTCSQYLKRLKKEVTVDPLASNWEATAEELKNNVPYRLWNNPENPAHQELWRLARLSWELKSKVKTKNDDSWAQKHLDRGLASCTWWWAAKKRPNVIGPFTWNPDEIEKGVQELLRSVRANDQATSEEKIEAEKIANELRQQIWREHWEKHAHQETT